MTDIDLYPSAVSPFDALRHVRDDGTEYWSARELMPILGYSTWQNFEVPISRAIKSAENQGHNLEEVFRASRKNPSEVGGRPFLDYNLTRFAAYLVSMNGDPNKTEVAGAQSYFAIKTREAETGRTLTRKDMALAVLAAEEELERANGRIAELEPVAAIATNLLDASGDWSVGHAAKILSRDPMIETGSRRLFGTMNGLGWIFRSGMRRDWEVKQRPLEQGLLSELARSHSHPHTGVEVIDSPQIRVTAKGLKRLHAHLGGSAPLVLSEVSA